MLSIFCYMLVLKNIYSTSSNYDFLTLAFFALTTIGLLWILGPKFNRIVGFILLNLYTLYLVSQKIYYRGFDQYYRFNTALGLTNEVKDVGGAIKELIKFEDILPFVILLIIFILFEIVYFSLQRKIKTKKWIRLVGILSIVFGILTMCLNVHSICATQNEYTDFDIYKSEYYIYKHALNANQFVDKMGLLTFMYRDAEMTFNSQNSDQKDVELLDEYFNNCNNTFLSNEMTGLLEGKNLLIVQAESLNLAAISEELTPNLYYYINSGINVKGFNTPLLIGSTSDTEFMANTSMIPETNGYPVCYEYIENEFPTTLGNMFASKGYDCKGYHNNYAEYYNRDIAFAKYGYEFLDSAKLGLENLEPDTKLAEMLGWISSEQDNFLGYWVSYSGHQPYNYTETGVNDDDVKKIKSIYPDLEEEYVSYFAKNMDFDRALGKFVDVMDWSGRYEDFAIIVYGDHKVKGLDFSKGTNFDQVVGINSDDNPEIYNTPLFIWAPGIEHMEIDKPCTSLDLLPTIANLWNIDYNHKTVFGHDLFDENYHGFRFNAEGDYLTADFEYNLSNDTVTIKNDKINEEAARKEICGFNKMREICNKILVNDYFANNIEGE